jgi:hypothetical protein
MPKFTIQSSETVCYETVVEAESYDKALDLFHGIYFPKEVPTSYEGFQIDAVYVNGKKLKETENA